MAKLNLLRLFRPAMVAFCGVTAIPGTPELEPVAQKAIPAFEKVNGEVIGGISGVVFSAGRLFLLSDDRGRGGRPRFFEAQLERQRSSLLLSHWKVHFLKGHEGASQGLGALDPEGLARLSGGHFLVASEADTNQKPRTQNRVFQIDAEGNWKSELNLGLETQPERIGRQRHGSENNGGPEGLSLTPDERHLWVGFERPLVQEPLPGRVRFERYQLGKEVRRDLVRSYDLDPAGAADLEVFRGVSALLATSSHQMFVLERTMVLRKTGLEFSGAIFWADCHKEPCEKRKIYDLEEKLRPWKSGPSLGNYEGLAWGPRSSRGERSIFLVSDNNFSGKVPTELILFQVRNLP